MNHLLLLLLLLPLPLLLLLLLLPISTLTTTSSAVESISITLINSDRSVCLSLYPSTLLSLLSLNLPILTPSPSQHINQSHISHNSSSKIINPEYSRKEGGSIDPLLSQPTRSSINLFKKDPIVRPNGDFVCRWKNCHGMRFTTEKDLEWHFERNHCADGQYLFEKLSLDLAQRVMASARNRNRGGDDSSSGCFEKDNLIAFK